MGIVIRKRIKITPGITLNLSKTGVSASLKRGPVTINSRGGVSVRLAKGISYRTKFKK